MDCSKKRIKGGHRGQVKPVIRAVIMCLTTKITHVIIFININNYIILFKFTGGIFDNGEGE